MGRLAAGPAATAYLWLSRRDIARKAALIVAGVSIATMAVLLASVRHKIDEAGDVSGRHPTPIARGIQGFRSTLIAIPDILILRKLGIDTEITLGQAAALCVVIGWCWFRDGLQSPNRLEDSEAVIVLVSLSMVYFFRADYPYEEVRPLGWYHAISQVGTILFAAG